MNATATRDYLGALRVKAPGLAEHSDGALVMAAGEIAGLAYSGHYAEAWGVAAGLTPSEFEQRHILREALTTLYPVALRVGEPATRA